MVSSAQVAYHYGYTLKEALALSTDERRLLIATVVVEKEKTWERLESILGTKWSVEELESEHSGPEAPVKNVRLPIVPMLAPEIFQSIVDKHKKAAASKKSLGQDVIEMGTLSRAEAKALLKNLG